MKRKEEFKKFLILISCLFFQLGYFLQPAITQQNKLKKMRGISGPEIETPLNMLGVLPDGLSAKLILDETVYESIKYQQHTLLRNFILQSDRIVDLELEQFSIFDDETEFVARTASGDRRVKAPEVALLRGWVKGYEDSHVFLGLSPHGTNGIIQLEGDIYYISPNKRSQIEGRIPEAFICHEKYVLWSLDPPSFCKVTDKPSAIEKEAVELPEYPPLESTLYLADVALDGTFSYYQLMGSNLNVALTYLVQLTAASSAIYERDLNTKLWLNYSRVWTVADPFTEVDSLELSDFRNYWNDNMGSVDRDLAAKISNSYSGGISYLDVLCNRSWSYSVCGLLNGFFPQPVTPGDHWWDLLVVCHEWGHTFGSHHTHCYSPPIDSCYNQEDGCYSGQVVCTRGTIMSYCHQCGGTGDGTDNVDPNFHSRVSANILSKLSGKSCLDAARDPCYVDLNNTGDEDGTSSNPWNTVQEGIRGVIPGGTIYIYPGRYSENITVMQSAILRRWGSSGIVIIGE